MKQQGRRARLLEAVEFSVDRLATAAIVSRSCGPSRIFVSEIEAQREQRERHVYHNYFVPPYYDSLIGKVITYGDTREQAIARMRIALSEMVVEGIKTNIPLHQELLLDEKFIRGGTSIHYLEEKLAKRKQVG